AGDNLTANGRITSTEVVIAKVVGTAYGSNVQAHDSSIGIDSPFPYRFQGTIAGLDLRALPDTIPVPHVESALTFDYDTSGRFSDPFITAQATFAQSTFLGATLRAGLDGTFDTSQKPFRYSGDGVVDGMNLGRLGKGLDVAWLRDPRYRGSVSGRFRVDGTGGDRAMLTLTANGRISQADLFGGSLSNADVSLEIDGGTLGASYSGTLMGVNPAVPFADSRFESTLTGSLTMATKVRNLLTSDTTTLSDFDVSGAMSLEPSTLRGFRVDSGNVQATLRDRTLLIPSINVKSSALDGHGAGKVAIVDGQESAFDYEITHADLAQLKDVIGRDLGGQLSTNGRLTGTNTAPHVKGSAAIMELRASDLAALTATSEYDATFPEGGLSTTRGQVSGHGSSFTVLGSSLQEATWNVSLDQNHVTGDVRLTKSGNVQGQIAGSVLLQPEANRVAIADLSVGLGTAVWHLAGNSTGSVSWDTSGIAVDRLEFVDGTVDERVALEGSWKNDGSGSLHVTANHLFLETFESALGYPTRYGGSLDLDATIRGTREKPRVTSTLAITNGRVERVTYQKLAGRIDYSDDTFATDLRLDQGPGVWLTASGRLPLALFDKQRPAQPIDVQVKSSVINLGLIEGATDVVRNVSGTIQMDVNAVGTSHDPQFTGSIEVANAGFLVAPTGSRYEHIRAVFSLAPDRVTVESLHIEDTGHHSLDIHGSLGTVALSVANVQVEANAKGFEVLRNDLGRLNVDMALQLSGRLDTPQVSGEVTIESGNLKADEILSRALARPYSTEPTPTTQVDAVVALNPWDRLGLDIALHVPNSLRLTGSDLQVASTSLPVSLGDVKLRGAGDLYLYKGPGNALSITGSLDTLSGTYTFQGKRFDVDEDSSIDFRGDLNPGLYVMVTRLISAVEARVTIAGTLQQPELHLSSVPPLDPSDVLSLIVFNTSSNQLSAPQQQDLLARAGTLAAGFVATPLLSALESRLGLNALDIDPTGDFGVGPKVTVGEEIAPGLLAQFTRQFGPEPYDVATVEYYLSRLFRLRATFSDAQSLIAMSPFRRIERAGIDLLLFFSF
ncbi:MAG TPA: translocation/assembly module TamB domain-containing protein, partial [Vicinamibacterales bacterium]|nr:translocation/assembly module TamB domain-containing protein [Vicinamibacterales bacterium]